MSHKFDSNLQFPNCESKAQRQIYYKCANICCVYKHWLMDRIAVQHDVCTLFPLVLQMIISETCNDFII